ncbi:MAG: response regulator [Bacteroidota bacterium]|nr:response regulator [Bacteroidota bacterium]
MSDIYNSQLVEERPLTGSSYDPDLSGKTILVVEDNYSNFYLLKVHLNKLKANVIHSRNGQEAIESFRNNNIDLVLMDLKMPEMNGYDAMKAIKSIRPDVIIIAQTAFAMSGDREKALARGFDDYLTKPIRKSELAHYMQKYLTSKE